VNFSCSTRGRPRAVPAGSGAVAVVDSTEVLVTNQRGPLTVDVQTWTLGYVAPEES